MRTNAIRIGPVDHPVAVVVTPIIAVRFRRGCPGTAISRATALILTGITGCIPANGRWSTIHFTVEAVLATFADAVATAEPGRRLEAGIAIHGAVVGFLACTSTDTVAAAPSAVGSTGAPAVRRAGETVLAVGAARTDAIAAGSTGAADTVVRAVITVFSRIARAVVVANVRLANAVDTGFTRRARNRNVRA